MEDYPKTLAELEKRFATEDACREYLFRLRWSEGFSCPKCRGGRMTYMSEGLYLCLDCNRKTSVTQEKLFYRLAQYAIATEAVPYSKIVKHNR